MPVVRAADTVAGEPVVAVIAETDASSAGFFSNLDIFGFKIVTDPVTGIGFKLGQILLNAEILA